VSVGLEALELFLNDADEQIAPGASAAAEVRAFHERMPGYAVTPLRPAAQLARALGVRAVFVKDESARLGLPSFKILGASWATYRALAALSADGLEPWRDVEQLAQRVRERVGAVSLAAATDGNHGRAVARMARLLGLEAEIFVPTGTSLERIAAIRSEGASVTPVDGSYEAAVRRSAEEAGPRRLVISDTSWPGYERVPRDVIDGYETIFAEVEQQLAAAGERWPDVVVVQIGVGALACAASRAVRGAPGEPRRSRLLGVEPLDAACVLASARAGRPTSVPGPHRSIMAGLNCDTPSLIAWPVISRAFDVFAAVSDDAARAAMRELAAIGIVAGETGGAGLAGLVSVRSNDAARAALALDADASVLLINTEGATDAASYRSIVEAR
jgi:diaminopropionate ammonia-lyase